MSVDAGKSAPGPLADRNFLRFYLGYVISLFGAGMESVAVAFAVLGAGGTPTELGVVIAGGVTATVVCMLAGGVAADRFGRRRVMIVSDSVRFLAEGTFAALVLFGHPSIWMMFVLYAVHSACYGFFTPAVVGLTPDLVEEEQLQRANVLIGVARDVGIVGGPAVAGVLVALAGPGLVLAIDAATYAISVVAVVSLRIPPQVRDVVSTPLGDLRAGFGAWRAQSWIWITSVTCALFNAIVYAPFLVLGPIVADEHLGGGSSWGLILAAQGVGSVVAAPLMLRWSPARPLVVVVAAWSAWALPAACLALLVAAPITAVAALLGGVGLAIYNVLWTTMLQRKVDGELLSRVSSVDAVFSYALCPIGLVVAAAVAQATGTAAVLWAAAIWQIASTVVLLSLPAVRRLRA